MNIKEIISNKYINNVYEKPANEHNTLNDAENQFSYIDENYKNNLFEKLLNQQKKLAENTKTNEVSPTDHDIKSVIRGKMNLNNDIKNTLNYNSSIANKGK